jgi:hypothetical protein
VPFLCPLGPVAVGWHSDSGEQGVRM